MAAQQAKKQVRGRLGLRGTCSLGHLLGKGTPPTPQQRRSQRGLLVGCGESGMVATITVCGTREMLDFPVRLLGCKHSTASMLSSGE